MALLFAANGSSGQSITGIMTRVHRERRTTSPAFLKDLVSLRGMSALSCNRGAVYRNKGYG
jgi:hypothetical protein